MSSSSRVRVGTLVPLVKDNAGSSNALVPSIPIFVGSNVVGRSNLVVVDKRVSRKHLSLHTSVDGSVEVIVEGPNPVVVQSEGQKRKVCAQERAKIAHDDVMELIPGDYFVKYMKGDECKSSTLMDSSGFKKGKRHSEDDSVAAKRNRQIMEDEALARTLQSGAEYAVPRQSYFDAVDKQGRVACLLVLPTTGMSIIGNVMQMNLHVLYDLDSEVFSFAPADCASV